MHPRFPRVIGVLSMIVLLASGAVQSQSGAWNSPDSGQTRPDRAANLRVRDAYGKLPMSFEVNEGQADSNVRFLSRGSGYTLALTATEAVLALRQPAPARQQRPVVPTFGALEAERREAAVLRMKLVNANPEPNVAGADALPGKSHYFTSRDPAKWRTNLSQYAKVRYQGVYPGVDLVYYGNQRQLEYDFIVAPGAHPGNIGLVFEGADAIRIDANGDLVLRIAGGELRHRKPFAYQDVDGARQEIPARYVLQPRDQVAFEVGPYDQGLPLVIDPTLVYSTFLGGTGDDGANGIALDAAGNAYVTGGTQSADFPTTAGASDTTLDGTISAFVTKLDPTGTVLLYSTFVGSDTQAIGIAVDASGNAYIAGLTGFDFPAVNAFQPFNGGHSDGFISKLDATGSTLLYSSFIGGGGNDLSIAVAVDATGNAYVGGINNSQNSFPTTADAFQQFAPDNVCEGGSSDGNVTKVDTNAVGAASLMYSTHLAGSWTDGVQGIAVDSAGHAYVTGGTGSGNFPTTTGAYDVSHNSPHVCFDKADVYVTKLNPTGTGLVYSTFVGGADTDVATNLALDAAGNAYVTGVTLSGDFPTTVGAFDTSHNGAGDAMVVKVNADGTGLVYSTFVGGSSGEHARGITVDGTGSAYVTGQTNSADFPTTIDAPQTTFGGGTCAGAPCLDAFVTKLSALGSALAYSTFLGGDLGDSSGGVAVDAAGNTYVAGFTQSTGFPTTPGAFSTTKNGGNDAFVAKIGPTVPVNVPPVALDDGHSTDEDTSLSVNAPGVLGNDTDANGDSLTVVLVSGPSQASSFNLNADGSFTYTPVANFNGSDSFSYKANDGSADSNIATVSIAVGAVNDAPTIASDQASVTVAEGSLATNSGSYGDIDSAVVTVSVTAGPGSVTANNGTWNWSFSTTDDLSPTTVTITASDGQASSSTSFTLTVTNVAPTPTIGGAPASGPEGTAINLTGSATDPGADSVTLSWSVTKDGSPYATGSGASFSFTPNDNGSYVVTLIATDDAGATGSDTKTISVTNVAPVIGAISKAPAKRASVFYKYSDAGSADTHTCVVTWGDGASTTVAGMAQIGRCFASHTYRNGGFYTVTVKVIDDDGGSVAETFRWFITGSGRRR